MSDAVEDLRQELQAAQRALAESIARCESHDAEHQAVARELESARRKVEQAHKEWMDALDVVDDPIFLHDKEFRILRCNKAYQRCAGIPFKQIIGRLYYEIFPRTAAPIPCCLRATGKAEEKEEVAAGGEIYHSRAFPIHDEQGAYLYSVHTLENVTGSRRAEAALREGEEKFRKITGSAQDAIIMMGADQRVSFWNTAAERIFGYTAAEAMGQELHALIVSTSVHERFAQASPHFQASGEGPLIGKVTEVSALRKSGEEFPAELSISATQFGGQWHAIGIVRDITGRKRAEQELLKSRQRAQHYLDIAGVMLIALDAQGRVQMVNRKGCEMLGHSEAGILGKNWFDNYLPEPARKEVREVFSRMMDGNIAPVEYFENDILAGSGDVLTVAWHNSLLLDESGKINGTLSSGEDITARKRAEIAIRHANRALATLSAVNKSLVRAGSESELLQSICQAIVRQRGYRLAWVGYVQHDESKSIRIMARAGHDEGYLDALQLTWAETERGLGSSGRAVRGGVTQLCQDIAGDPHYLPWRAAALKHGYAANISLPLLNGDNTVFGILNVYAEETNAFSPEEIGLLEEMAGDLSFGVRSLHTRQERDLAQEQSQRHLAQLHGSLEDTVRAMASLVEMRDPYTAGHQVRVADLAAAIAKQMRLPDDRVHGIHLAGVVHDLGKIKVPAEILSKPGRITDIEYSLIKVHPQAGYDVLLGISFPWPIAQMVLQHHERLDGSGYPQGIKGDAILPEARILSVADVVEAMSSHRPYRAGLGIEAALAEIAKHRGIHYDPIVVDACLTVFREQNYRFPDQ